MSATLNDLRIQYVVPSKERDEHEPLVQTDPYSNRRTRIRASSVEVNAFTGMREGPRFYVRVEGPLVRLSDDVETPGKRRTVAYWWTHEHADHRLESAPEWVRDIAADGRARLEAALAEA